ncbi:hypothetical protein AGOR_G00172340 [Albula goreensis]|uniref:Ig-like domain-containing protein n=1 Tax=Albula goreensis TaxID=1534307 RepID=A0A8T3CTW9_9TELE|nr:hypothetical protein AGOR_G00172340 [Albula goreensis]
MDLLLTFLLLIITLPAVPCVNVGTLGRLSVQRGRSISIPCFYTQKYKDNVKYWCRGGTWAFCSPVVRTDTPQQAGRVSIIDDSAQQVFTVTMRNLQEGDSDTYWCGVEINSAADDGFKLYLTVTEGPAALSVLNNMVSGEEGGSVSIQCHYGDSLRTSVKRWCSFLERSPCLTPGGTGMSQHASVQISDNRRGAFTVTVRGLERKDTGWYFCSAGEEHIPVHITVTQRVTQRAVTQRAVTTRAVTQRVTTTAALQKTEGSSSTAHQTAAASDLSTENGLIPSTAQNLTHRAPSRYRPMELHPGTDPQSSIQVQTHRAPSRYRPTELHPGTDPQSSIQVQTHRAPSRY